MALNTNVFSGRLGMFRIITLVLGVIDLGITADKYNSFAKEEFFLAMVIIMFIVSAILCILFVLEVVSNTDAVKKGDMAFHFIGGLLLIISGIVWLVSVFEWGKYWSTGHYVLRIFAGIIGIINGVVYVALGYTLHGGGGAAA
jgi:hypothetical protein